LKGKGIVPFNRHSIWLVLVACLGLVILSVTVCGAEVPEPLYDINEAITIRPEEYEVQGRHLSLFPVPQDNSVGTNDMGNAITLLSFHKRRLSEDKYFRDAADDFEGGGTYLPVIDESTIGFAQMRRFLLFDFKSKDCRDYLIVMSLEKTIEEVAIADAKKKHFLFEIEAHNPRSVDPWDCTYHFLLMDLSDTEPKLLKEAPSNEGFVWSMVDEKIFLWEFDEKQLQVLNKLFEEDTHPLADVIRANKEEIRFMVIHPHPHLPFAILSGGRNGAFVVNWGPDREKIPHSLFKRAYEFSFSPDGKWVVFKEGGRMDSKKTYLMPVSEKYPNYLGSPILLHDKAFGGAVNNKSAWTTNPISFVGSRLDKLYRWELTNEAHPESDKPTFHDYIVEKDLEKLTREKRQGLGEKPE
jgi:hypothetical protein